MPAEIMRIRFCYAIQSKFKGLIPVANDDWDYEFAFSGVKELDIFLENEYDTYERHKDYELVKHLTNLEYTEMVLKYG